MKHTLLSWAHWVSQLLSWRRNGRRKWAEVQRRLRVEQVKQILLTETFSDSPVCLGGYYNWFTLSDGKTFPRFDVLLQDAGNGVPVVVIVLGVEHSFWEEAWLCGVSRAEWEAAQENLAILRKELTERTCPTILVGWTDPINPLSLGDRVKRLLDPNNEDVVA